MVLERDGGTTRGFRAVERMQKRERAVAPENMIIRFREPGLGRRTSDLGREPPLGPPRGAFVFPADLPQFATLLPARSCRPASRPELAVTLADRGGRSPGTAQHDRRGARPSVGACWAGSPIGFTTEEADKGHGAVRLAG